MDREKLLYQIMGYDFSALDLRLYLDTHPNDKEALSEYNRLISQSRKLKAEYESRFAPLSQNDLTSEDEFKWIDDPWSWERNYMSKGEK